MISDYKELFQECNSSRTVDLNCQIKTELEQNVKFFQRILIYFY